MSASAEENKVQLQKALEHISEVLAGLRFGSLEITVHEGRIVQIERRERIRLQTEPVLRSR